VKPLKIGLRQGGFDISAAQELILLSTGGAWWRWSGTRGIVNREPPSARLVILAGIAPRSSDHGGQTSLLESELRRFRERVPGHVELGPMLHEVWVTAL
jgi:hypothetical protein